MSSAKGTVLVIEDNAANAEMAIDLLKDAGFTTLYAPDAEQGFQLAQRSLPNIILMDVFMPFRSGLDLLPSLKAEPALATIPVIAFTALGLAEERERLIASGCAGVITKPIEVARFVDMVAQYLTEQRPYYAKPYGDTPVRPLPIPDGKQDAKPVGTQCAELEQAEHALRETISRLSHDLQAPARKIHQFCDILLSADASSLSEENRQWVERIDRSSQQLLDTLAKNMERLAPH